MACLILVFGVAACRDAPPVNVEEVPGIEVPIGSSPPDSPATGSVSSYNPSLGELLLVPMLGDPGGEMVSILSPMRSPDLPVGDTTGLGRRVSDGQVTLFGRVGEVGGARLEIMGVTARSTDVCAWPTGRLVPMSTEAEASESATSGSTTDAPLTTVATAPEGALSRSWLIALPAGRAQAIPLDSIETLPARDSAQLAAGLTRLVSGLAEDSASEFRGLPFSVTRAYRTGQGPDAIILGVLVRRVPQEDRPLEERVFVVVSALASDPGSWRIAWHDRVGGREEEVIATEPLAVVQYGSPARVGLFLGRDDGTGTALSLLERVGGRWRLRWESPVTGC